MFELYCFCMLQLYVWNMVVQKNPFHCFHVSINKIASHNPPVSAFKFDELSDFFFLGDFGCRKQLMKGNEKNKTFLVKVTRSK